MTHQWNLITTPRVDGCGIAGLGVAVLGEWCGVEGGGAGAECRRGGKGGGRGSGVGVGVGVGIGVGGTI